MKISIIVPLYYGRKYVTNILEQVNENANNVKGVQVELIIYNDSPEQSIEIINKNDYIFDIRLIQPKYNSGIHGARVKALDFSTGEYVLFLDQDDKISSLYLKKQLYVIGKMNADVVICQAKENNKFHYNNTLVFEEAITKEFLLKNFNPIISPGQVLLKKKLVPRIWRENILNNNGADDYFLWLLLFANKSKIVLNRETLFEHIITGFNSSCNTNQMMDSEMEMINILLENNVFQGKDLESLKLLPTKLRRMHISNLEKYRDAYIFEQEWKYKKDLGAYLKKYNKNIVIYGYGIFGRYINEILHDSGIMVEYFMDQNAEFIDSNIPIYSIDTAPKNIDIIILTIKSQKLKTQLETMFECEVYYPEELFVRKLVKGEKI